MWWKAGWPVDLHAPPTPPFSVTRGLMDVGLGTLPRWLRAQPLDLPGLSHFATHSAHRTLALRTPSQRTLSLPGGDTSVYSARRSGPRTMASRPWPANLAHPHCRGGNGRGLMEVEDWRPTLKTTARRIPDAMRPPPRQHPDTVRSRDPRLTILRLDQLQGRMTLGQIARATGLHVSYVSRVWAGKRMPSLEATALFARALGVTRGDMMDVFLGDERKAA